MKFFLIAAVFVLSAAAVSDSEWKTYKAKHKKNYVGPNDGLRRALHQKTDDAIKAHNSKAAAGLATYTQELNQFSDMTDAEKAQYVGFRPKTNRTRNVETDHSLYDRAVVLPANYDLRTNKCMPAIKNQGKCGGCWAFATTTPIEFQYCSRRNKNVSLLLSDQQLTDCTYAYDGCKGGDHHDAWNYLYRAPGMQPSAGYPFVSGSSGVRGTCKFSKTAAIVKLRNTGTDIAQNETTIQTALYTYGPITFAFYVAEDFFNYKTGIYSTTDCLNATYYNLNHEMVLVGYGVNGTNPYWIVRNTWGTTWGQLGYAFVKRGVNMCGIKFYAGYPTVA